MHNCCGVAVYITVAQVFDGESLLVAPQQPASSLSVPLTPRRDTPVLLLMKVLVGSRTSSIYHVFELDLGTSLTIWMVQPTTVAQLSVTHAHVVGHDQHIRSLGGPHGMALLFLAPCWS